jgi:hypothetical protein
MTPMELVAAHGLLDSESLLQLSTTASHTLTRSARHGAMKRQMQVLKAKVALDRRDAKARREDHRSTLRLLHEVTDAYGELRGIRRP